MTQVTLSLALCAVVIALLVRPGQALGVVFLSMMVWPEYLRFALGPVQMSIPRAAAVALLTRLLLSRRHAFRPMHAADLCVIGLWAWTVAANAMMGLDVDRLGTCIGMALDTVVMYFAARLSVRSVEDLKDLATPVCLGAAIVGALSLQEAFTGRSPFTALYQYRLWSWFEKPPEYRLGLLRARGPTGHAIYLGMFMVSILGALWALRGIVRRKSLWLLGLGGAAGGVFASLSSGPWLTAAVLAICASFYYQTALIRPALWVLLLASLMLEVLSNRHCFELIDYLALSGATAWYRTRLIEVAIEQLPEYWLLGYGGGGIGHWGRLIDGRGHVDIVNNYVLIAVNGGMLALSLYIGAKSLVIRQVARAFSRVAALNRDVSMVVFGLGATLVAMSIGEMSVGLFGAALLSSYLLLGIAIGVSGIRDGSVGLHHWRTVK